MANTTNYNWETPDDTDLVKDGAAAIRTLGSSVDTTTKALNPSTTLGDIEYRSSTANTNTRLGIGTTGQVLTVAGGVPTWATSDDANAIQNAIVDAKGDLIAATAADSPARLPVGTNGQVLTADSAEATGLKWATAAGGGKVLQVVSTVKSDTFTSSAGSGTYADITGLSASITPSATTSKILVMVDSQIAATAGTNRAAVQLVRGSTAIDIGDAAGSRILASTTASSPNSDSIESSSFSFLDSPSTTSSTTYKVQIAMISSGSVYVNRSANDSNTNTYVRTASTITLMEIGA